MKDIYIVAIVWFGAGIVIGAVIFLAGFEVAWHTGDYTMTDKQAQAYCKWQPANN